MAASPLLSIVTGTALTRLPYLKAMVNSARRSMVKGISYEIIVVAGQYPQEGINWIKEQSDIRLIIQHELVGAIHAFGAGFDIAKGKYTIIGNDDIFFMDSSITRALAYMEDHPDVGIGCFYQNRGGRDWHVDYQPAHYPNGQGTSIHYGQVCILPTTVGHELGWWGHKDARMSKARTYGGDCWLTSRAIEAGYRVEPMPDCKIHDGTPEDELREFNRAKALPSLQHPDTAIYLSIYPNGPEITGKLMKRSDNREFRVLYAPIYEPGHKVQHEQKAGLRRALQRIGIVIEVDYQAGESILEIAQTWQPDLFIGQFHDGTTFTASQMNEVRKHVRWKSVLWNGDVYDRSELPEYVDLCKQFDLSTFVNADAVKAYRAKGVQAAYWQVAYEPLIVGEVNQTPDIDVIFCGNGYSYARIALGKFLKALPYNVHIYGTSWPAGVSEGDTLYDFQRNGALLRRAKIAIGDSQHYNQRTGTGFVSDRLFNTLAAGGALLLHQEFPGMTDYLHLESNKHLATWRTYEDMAEQITYFLASEARRQELVRNGRKEVLRNHSFERRVAQLLDMLHNPNNVPAGIDPGLIDVTYA